MSGKSEGERIRKCLPLVNAPPTAHPRFMPCRLILHIPALDASVRRALMFALTGSQWLPPEEPVDFEMSAESPSFLSELSPSVKSSSSPISRKSNKPRKSPKTFSFDIVNSSSVSFLEVLQLITLQAHTLEECARMHETHPTLDYENKNLSSSLSIESYLKRLLYVPHSLSDAWALQCYLDGPLPSKGSGENRGSILGLLIALYEHRSDNSSNATGDSSHGDKGLGGARFLVADGLKWFLRFVHALVQGAHSISQAYHCAHDGNLLSTDVLDAQWTIDGQITSLARGMLEGLQDLCPSSILSSSNEEDSGMSSKNREASKAAQKRAMDAIRKRQNTFAKSLNKH